MTQPHKSALPTKHHMPHPEPGKDSNFPALKVQTNNFQEPVDAFMDGLIEGLETVLKTRSDCLTTTSVLQRELESRLLPSIELTRFDGNPKHGPGFIQCFKEQVHCENSLSDTFCMNLLVSLLDREAKRLVTAIGKNRIFYTSASKSLIRELGNPFAVCTPKIKGNL